jgi:hypothetical protein
VAAARSTTGDPLGPLGSDWEEGLDRRSGVWGSGQSTPGYYKRRTSNVWLPPPAVQHTARSTSQYRVCCWHRADLHAARLRCSDAAPGRADAVGEHTRAEQHPARNSVTGKKGSFTCTISLSARSEAASITTCRLRCRLAGGARRGQVRRAVSLVACGSLWRGPLILGFHSRSWGLARASKARSAATPPCDGPSAPGSRAVPRRRDDAPHRLWPRRRNALYPHST